MSLVPIDIGSEFIGILIYNGDRFKETKEKITICKIQKIFHFPFPFLPPSLNSLLSFSYILGYKSIDSNRIIVIRIIGCMTVGYLRWDRMTE